MSAGWIDKYAGWIDRGHRLMTGATFDARSKKPERSQALGAHVREARAKLSGISAGLSFNYELLALFVSSQYRTAFALPLLAIIAAGYCLNWLPLQTSLLWFSALIMAQGIQLVLCREFNKEDPVTTDAKVWGGKFAASEFLMSTVWASLAYFVWEPMAPQEHMLAVGVLLIVVVIRMTATSSYMTIVLAGTVPITIAIVHLAVMDGGPIHYGMALFAIATELYALQLARSMHNTARNMLEYRAQKDALVAELETAKFHSEEALKRAEEASAAKSHFLATMSHELRTPLNAILGFSEVMKDEIMGPHSIPCYREYSYDIHRSGEHLLNLINQVLEHSKVESGRYKMQEYPVLVQDVATDCKELMSLKIKDGGIDVFEQFDVNLPKLLGDERALRQIWLNLISNAVKFTPSGGQIHLRVGHTASGGLFLSVRDTGPGIPKDEIPNVLSSFGQGSLSYETAQEGAGLGLPIVRGLVELHGGSFSLQSELGVGTEAIAEFPRNRMVRSSAAPAPVEAEHRRAVNE